MTCRAASGPPSTSHARAGPACRRGSGRPGGSMPRQPTPALPTSLAPRTRRPTTPPPSTVPAASPWQDYLPRIVDAIPRRVPGPHALTFPSAADAADAARRLFFPESLTDPATLTVPVLIFGALAVGVGVEVASLALRALPGSGGEEGEGNGGGDPTATADEEEEGEGEGRGPGGRGPASPALEEINVDRVMGERYRGLAWLAGAAGLALYSAGLLTGSDKPLQP